MNIIEFFSLSFRHVIIFANLSTTFFSSKINLFISSMIKSASKIASIINITIFFAIEIKRDFKYIVSMFFSKINEISYFHDHVTNISFVTRSGKDATLVDAIESSRHRELASSRFRIEK